MDCKGLDVERIRERLAYFRRLNIVIQDYMASDYLHLFSHGGVDKSGIPDRFGGLNWDMPNRPAICQTFKEHIIDFVEALRGSIHAEEIKITCNIREVRQDRFPTAKERESRLFGGCFVRLRA